MAKPFLEKPEPDFSDRRAAGAKELRIGVIGAGFIAQVAHLHAFSRIPEACLVTLAESDDFLRSEVASKFGIRDAMSNYRDLLRRQDIDAFVVCVPRRAQALVVAEALSKGRPVLSEKPVAMTFDEAERMVSLAERAYAPWMVGYMKRFDPGVRRFKQVLSQFQANGDLGDMLSVEMRDFCATYGVSIPEHVRRPGPRAYRYAEGPVAPDFLPPDRWADYEYTVNVASHDINLLRMLFDEALSVTSFVARPQGAQLARFDSAGIPINLVVAPMDVGYWDQRVDVNFRKGRLTLTLPSPLARDRYAQIYLERHGAREEILLGAEKPVWAFEAQASAFVETALARTVPPNSGAACLADMEIIETLWKRMEWR